MVQSWTECKRKSKKLNQFIERYLFANKLKLKLSYDDRCHNFVLNVRIVYRHRMRMAEMLVSRQAMHSNRIEIENKHHRPTLIGFVCLKFDIFLFVILIIIQLNSESRGIFDSFSNKRPWYRNSLSSST